jgi:hypothetical protein
MDANEHQLLGTWFLVRRSALSADPAFQKLCEEKQPPATPQLPLAEGG